MAPASSAAAPHSREHTSTGGLTAAASSTRSAARRCSTNLVLTCLKPAHVYSGCLQQSAGAALGAADADTGMNAVSNAPTQSCMSDQPQLVEAPKAGALHSKCAAAAAGANRRGVSGPSGLTLAAGRAPEAGMLQASGSVAAYASVYLCLCLCLGTGVRGVRLRACGAGREGRLASLSTAATCCRCRTSGEGAERACIGACSACACARASACAAPHSAYGSGTHAPTAWARACTHAAISAALMPVRGSCVAATASTSATAGKSMQDGTSSPCS